MNRQKYNSAAQQQTFSVSRQGTVSAMPDRNNFTMAIFLHCINIYLFLSGWVHLMTQPGFIREYEKTAISRAYKQQDMKNVLQSNHNTKERKANQIN